MPLGNLPRWRPVDEVDACRLSGFKAETLNRGLCPHQERDEIQAHRILDQHIVPLCHLPAYAGTQISEEICVGFVGGGKMQKFSPRPRYLASGSARAMGFWDINQALHSAVLCLCGRRHLLVSGD